MSQNKNLSELTLKKSNPNPFEEEMDLIQNSVLYNNADEHDSNTPYAINSIKQKK
jgi:hypothetical protein